MVVDQKRLLLDLWVGKIEFPPSIGSVALTGGSCIQQRAVLEASLVLANPWRSGRAALRFRMDRSTKAKLTREAVAELVGAPSPGPGC